jgi:hypothetical protein
MPRHQKAERTGGIYANRSEYFKKGKDPGLYADKGSAHHQGGEELADGYSRVAHQDAPEPVSFTQSRTARKGGGFDLGPKEYIYKKVKQKKAEAPKAEAAPEAKAPAEPEKDKGPVKLSPEVAQAKERVNNWKSSIDGTAGSTFATSAPAETPEPDAMPNSVSFAPAEINTPAYKPNDGNAEQAQSLADKYKLNLLNKGAGQANFSGV